MSPAWTRLAAVPLAGPVVAAAVVFPAGVPRRLAACLDDSKKLTAEQRAAAFAALQRSGCAEIGVGAASVTEITRINILQASLLAMRRAVSRLPVLPDLALVDGDRPPLLPCPVQCVIGGDATSLSIAAASIVAKVLRDRAMARLAIRFPGYGWESNAGYGTSFTAPPSTAWAPRHTTVPPSAPSASSHWPCWHDAYECGSRERCVHGGRAGGNARCPCPLEWNSPATFPWTRSCSATASA